MRRFINLAALTLLVVSGAAAQSTVKAPGCEKSPAELAAGAFEKAHLDREARQEPPKALLKYPKEALEKGKTGSVSFHFVVDEKGKVEPCSVEVIAVSDAIFLKDAKEYLLDFTYQPALVKGVPVRSLVGQQLHFDTTLTEIRSPDLPAAAGCQLTQAEVAATAKQKAASLTSPVSRIQGPVPKYPKNLRGISGSVVVEFVVDTNGRPERCSVRVAVTSNSGFNANAIAAIMAAEYKPATSNGTPVRQFVAQTVVFSSK